MNMRRLIARSAAFTLIELLVVIAIIGLLAAMVAPSLKSFRKGDAMASATSQLLGGVARARQLAISQRTDVYMVFLPTNFWGTPLDFAQLSSAEKVALTNLADKQLSGYAFVSFRTVGDQPGQGSARYLSSWQALPDGIFIPEEKFIPRALNAPNPNYVINDSMKNESYRIFGFLSFNIPFPTATSTNVLLPCIVFDYQGRMITPLPAGESAELIPLAHGSVSVPRNPQTRQLQLGTAEAVETPPGSGTNGYNLVYVDWLTGRGHLERKETQ